MLAWMNSVGASEFLETDYAEVYILRAWYHYLLMDSFGNVPFMTKVGDAAPVQLQRAVVCDSIMNDLLKYVPKASEEKVYSRVNKFVGYMVLAKMYLNAEAWGVDKVSENFKNVNCYAKAAEYAGKVIDEGGYKLETDYFSNFAVENQGSKENIWCVFYDASFSKGMQFHMMSLHYASQEPYKLKNQPWNGYCTSHKVIGLYGEGDKRIGSWLRGAQPKGVDVAIDSVTFEKMPKYVRLPKNYPSSLADLANGPVTVSMPGYFTDTLTTFKNDEKTKIYNVFEGARFVKFQIQEHVGDHMSNDFPIFRLADAYLMKAEGLLRTGDKAGAIEAANVVRARAGAELYSDLTLDELSNERVRELCWEGFRRQDLIRFGRFTGPKSFAKDGDKANLWVFRTEESPEYKNVFPLPDFVISNYGYPQNDGYVE
jgi:hypothetical protein